MAKWAYLPEGCDDTWRGAKLAAGSAPAILTVLGDSTTTPTTGTTRLLENCWLARLRALLLEDVPLYGDFWPSALSTAHSAYGGFLPWVNNGAAAGDMTFTAPYECEGVDLIYLDGNTGTFDVKLDGGAAQQQSPS